MNRRKLIIILAIFCITKLVVHLVADFHSGFQGDELLHIDAGNHLDFGYMEFPPVIGLLAFMQNVFGSQSVLVHHIFVHLASLLIFVIVALTTVKLGGKTKAVCFVLLCLLAAPAFTRSQQLFQPVVFSQFCWLLCFYQLVCFVKTLEPKFLLYLSLSLAFGFLTKYDIVFFGIGLVGLLFFTNTRKAVFQKSTWAYAGLFLLLVAPNIFWQIQHHFPISMHMAELYKVQLNELEASDVVRHLFIELNPLTAIFWAGGFIFMFSKKRKALYRPVAVSIVLSIGFLAFSKGKAYYFYPAIITLFVFGSVWFENFLTAKRNWVMYLVAVLLILSGAFLMPFGMAILPLNRYIAYTHIEKEDDRFPIDFQEFYSDILWNNTLTSIKNVYDALGETEKANCLIWGKHYRQAGAVNLMGKNFELPKAISYHGSYYLWAPEQGELPKTIIAFSTGQQKDFWENYFEIVIEKTKVFDLYAEDEKDQWQVVYICRNPKQNFADLRNIFATRIFE